MKDKVIYTDLTTIKATKTAHNIGQKQVLADNTGCQSNLMQAAYGKLGEDDVIESHVHPTMEEFYYFTKGEAEFYIGEEVFSCKNGIFIKVPANTSHHIKPLTDIEFIYWGVAI